MDEGAFIVTSNDCPNLYSVFLSGGGTRPFQDRDLKASDIALKIKNKIVENVDDLIGFVQPSSVSAKYAFVVKRVK